MKLCEFFKLFEETPQQMKKLHGQQIIDAWNERYSDKIQSPDPAIEQMVKIAPPGETNQFIFWIYREWSEGHFDIRNIKDAREVSRYLQIFVKEKQAKRVNDPDIRKYDWEWLQRSLDSRVRLRREDEMKKKLKQRTIANIQRNDEIRVVASGPGYELLEPLTFRAAREFGRGPDTDGKWCVSCSQRHFDSNGPFYILNLANGNELYGRKRKFGIRLSTDDFQDEGNERLSNEEIENILAEYPKVKAALEDEGIEYKNPAFIGPDWIKRNQREFASMLVGLRYGDQNTEINDYSWVVDRFGVEWTKDLIEEIHWASSDCTEAITVCADLGIPSDIMLGEALDRDVFGEDFLNDWSTVFGLDVDTMVTIYTNPVGDDRLGDWISKSNRDYKISIESVMDVMSYDKILDMLSKCPSISKALYDYLSRESIGEEEAEMVKAAMSSSRDSFEDGVELIEDNIDFEEYYDEIMAGASAKLPMHDGGIGYMMRIGMQVTRDDARVAIQNDPKAFAQLAGRDVTITKEMVADAVRGNCSKEAMEWLIDNDYNIPLDYVKIALEREMEEDAIDEKYMKKLEQIIEVGEKQLRLFDSKGN